ncbi:hypothetical protein N780_08900 [Pontibacillus chungwhensis BH030062]|uniref:Uncharacterized protein n=1 Tax=Pontibacillus chungwhensis BH030062 TaxID=1385513 RepID=A0A0A2UXA7_9BACI|nr:hypothetical protein [Pontibacillus chungwhensis]KGP91348.1 hypothetical protein N780_08900 [Pontibacillus chungwhensis BH030062]
MKNIVMYFIFFAVFIHGVLDLFDGVELIYRLINLVFLMLIAVGVYMLSTKKRNGSITQD